MTRRERLERKLEKRQEWAASRAAKRDQARDAAFSVPLPPGGEPIKIGHHSEKRHRGAIAKVHSHMERSFEHSDMEKHHRGKAGGLAHQLNTCIFSDDPDAIEQLGGRVAQLEAQRDRAKAINASWRKAGRPAYGCDRFTDWFSAELSPKEQEHVVCNMARDPLKRGPFPSYWISNIGANIRRLKGRAGEIERQQDRQSQAEASPGGVSRPAMMVGGASSRSTRSQPGRSWLT